jgi:hypothetical protein
VRSHPTAGQATLEYIAAVALVAALLLVAAPAVGAPDIGRSLAGALRHGICLVGGDICTTGDARRAGLPPCPLRSDLTGAEGWVTAFSVELGGKWTLTVTPRSDGTVAVTRIAGGGAGFAGGEGADGSLGPVKFVGRGEGALRARVLAARGWVFRDAATARRFLEDATKNSFDDDRRPPAWTSVEVGGEASGSGGASVGDSGADSSGQVIGGAVTAGTAIGWRRFLDGSKTEYSRFNVDGSELQVAFIPSLWEAGRTEWVSEYTRGPHGEPREIVLRTAISRSANRVSETVAHLDLTDPANHAIARPFLGTPMPRSFPFGAARQALLDRIATHGTVERLTSDVDDDSRGAAFEVEAGIKFGFGGKRVSVHRTLVEATVRRGGLTGKRLDCVPARGASS